MTRTISKPISKPGRRLSKLDSPGRAYETPPHYVQALTDVIGDPQGALYEPCVGQGNIIAMLGRRLTDSAVRTNDLDSTVVATTHHDATDPRMWEHRFNWCITNPPFRQELPILQNALDHATNVAFLARLSFLEPTVDRRAFWHHWASQCFVLVLPRYSFYAPAGQVRTDSVTCCWLIFQDRERLRCRGKTIKGRNT